MSQTQAFISIADDDYDTKQAAKRYIEKTTSKLAQQHIPQGFHSIEKIKIEGENKTFNGISLTDVFNFWLLFTMEGNRKALALVAACGVEALERRADNAFGVLRTEQERNERFVTRRDSILSRTFWTDVIEDYTKTHEVSDNYRRFVYNNVSDYLNRSLFGKSSKEIREHYNIGNYSPRDYFPSQTIKLVDTIEKATGVRVKNNNVDPKQALKDVVSMLGIEPDENRL